MSRLTAKNPKAEAEQETQKDWRGNGVVHVEIISLNEDLAMLPRGLEMLGEAPENSHRIQQQTCD
jgi:hypothetical protein